MMKSLAAAAVAIVGMGSAVGAHAVPFDVTYSGSLVGLFGNTGTADFTLNFAGEDNDDGSGNGTPDGFISFFRDDGGLDTLTTSTLTLTNATGSLFNTTLSPLINAGPTNPSLIEVVLSGSEFSVDGYSSLLGGDVFLSGDLDLGFGSATLDSRLYDVENLGFVDNLAGGTSQDPVASDPTVPVPEPAALALIGGGLAAAGFLARRRNAAKA